MTKFEDEIYMVCLCEQKKRDLGIPKELFSFFNFSSFIHFGTLEKCLGRDARGRQREGREGEDGFTFLLHLGVGGNLTDKCKELLKVIILQIER